MANGNNKRSIQFRRNSSVIYNSREDTISAIEDNIANYSDGEQILGRYRYIDPNTSATTIVTLIGLVYIDNSGEKPVTNITYYDKLSIELEIKEAKESALKDLTWGEF